MATRRRTQAEKNPASPPASPSAVRRRQSSVGVDTSDLSDDPSTLPIVPKPGDKMAPWASYLIEGDHDTSAALRDISRTALMPSIVASAKRQVEPFQRFCGVRPVESQELKEHKPTPYPEAFLDPSASVPHRLWSLLWAILARLGAFLGGELFHITAFPFLFWNIDKRLGRMIVFLWVISMYVGQGAKDHIRLPRPAVINKRVRSLEGEYLAEYGFPSTHTMSVMGQACIVVWYTWRMDYAGQDTYPLGLAVAIAAVLVAVTAVGRMYLGVHTSTDIIGGLLLEAVIFWFFTKVGDSLDHFVLTNDATLYLPTLVLVIFLLIYPRPHHWTNAYGDTAMIAGVGHGVVLGSFLDPAVATNIPLPWLEVDIYKWLALAGARTALGLGTLILTRVVMKKIVTTVLLLLTPASSTPPGKRYRIVVPAKFVSYTAVAFMAVNVLPRIFVALGLTLDLIR